VDMHALCLFRSKVNELTGHDHFVLVLAVPCLLCYDGTSLYSMVNYKIVFHLAFTKALAR
jgi:hypothetical protein